MSNQRPTLTTSVAVRCLGAFLLGAALTVSADETSLLADQTQGKSGLTVQDALKAMAGTAGLYRVDPSGDTYLYPKMKLERDLYGIYGTYQVTPQGILMQPLGMEPADLSMASMGGVEGSFRITPNGEAFFQPAPHVPVGMGGMSGQQAH